MTHNFRLVIILAGAVLSPIPPIEAASDKSDDITISAIDQDSDERCGMTISSPNVKHIFDARLTFGCTGNYELDGGASLKMDFQFNPNDRNGGEYIGFFVRGVSISETAKLRSGFLLRTDENKPLDKISGKIIYKSEKTYCDLNVSTKITRIQGFNWHGWLAEESYTGKPRPHCTVPKEYTSRYRCVGLMIGNDQMSATTNQFCLLRKRELSLEHGFSYDLFMDMVKTIRFKEE